MTAASAPKVLARLKEVCDQVHKDAKDPDHRHNALLELKNLFCKPGRNGRIGDKADVLKELKDRTSFDECVKCVIEIADDSAQHAKTILQGTDTHARSQELNVKDMAASLIAPLYFHCCLAGHDFDVIFEYVFRLLATEDRGAFVEADPRSKLLLPKVKRGYAETALSEVIEMVKLHTSDSTHVEAGGWGECASAKSSMIQQIVRTLPAKFTAMLSPKQVSDDLDISMRALTLVFKSLEVPQICSGIHSGNMFKVLQPLIAPVDFKYTDGGAFRRRAIECAVMLALFGKSDGSFHPWREIIENTILDRLTKKPVSALVQLKGEKLRGEFLTEQNDLIDGLLFVLKDGNRDRQPLPSVALAFFSSTRSLISVVSCVAKLNAFTAIEDFQMDHSDKEYFGKAVDVTVASCKLLQAVCDRFPLSCTVEETRDVFFTYVQGALPMEDGHITETPVVEDEFEDEDDVDIDDTPSRSSSFNENDPLSAMYIAGIELEASLVKHVASQVDGDIQKDRIDSIMRKMYRKTTLESRVKDQVLSCITRHYNLSCFSKSESETFAALLFTWNTAGSDMKAEKLLDNVPSAINAIEFMDKVISSNETTREARVPFLDLTFQYVTRVVATSIPKLFASNDVVRKLVVVAMQFLLHAAPQWTRGHLLGNALKESNIVATIISILKNASSSEGRNVQVTSLGLQTLKAIVETGEAAAFHLDVFEFLLGIFRQSSSVNDFLMQHVTNTLALSRTMLERPAPATQEPASKVLIALLEYGKIKKDASTTVFSMMSDIAQTEFEFSRELIELIQEQAMKAITNESGNLLLSSLACVLSILKFKCKLDLISPEILQDCFKKAAQTQDFEVCSKILEIAALCIHSNSEMVLISAELFRESMFLLSSDFSDAGFVRALSTLAAVQCDAGFQNILEQVVVQLAIESTASIQGLSLDADGRGSKKMKTESASADCTLPGFIGFVFGFITPSHPLKSAIVAVVKRCLQTPGSARIFGMHCLRFIPQHADQLAASFCSEESDIVLNAFSSMKNDLDTESNAIHEAAAAFLLVNPEGFAPKLFAIASGAVENMVTATPDEAASVAAVALPKFLFFRKVLSQWIDHSIDIPSILIGNMLDICFQVPLSSEGAFAAVSTVCVGILGLGLHLEFKGADNVCTVLKFAEKDPAKTQAFIVDVVLASLSNSNLGSNLARDGMSQAVNATTLQMLRQFSIAILPPASAGAPSPDLTGNDVNTKMFKSALAACVAAVDVMGSSMPADLFQEISRCTCEFLGRFSAAPTTVQICRTWDALLKSQMSWPSVLVKAAIRQDIYGPNQEFNFKDFTHPLRQLALILLSKLASAAAFRTLNSDLQKTFLLRTISHLDDFRPEVSDKANEMLREFFKSRQLRALMKQAEMCKTLCDELNSIGATFAVFDQIGEKEDPSGKTPADQLLRTQKNFIKAIHSSLHPEQGPGRTSRVRTTAQTVQALLPQNSLLHQ